MEMGICSFKYAAGWNEIMARYPAFPLIFPEDVKKGVDYVYGRIRQWSAALINELDTRDQIQEGKPTSNIYAVVTVTTIKSPDKGDIAYSVSSGKFKGYVSTASTKAWQDLN
jgi:hypothetical protein